MGLATQELYSVVVSYPLSKGRNLTEPSNTGSRPVRLRPIFMTSLAIILGMVPTAFAVGASGSFRSYGIAVMADDQSRAHLVLSGIYNS